MTEPRPGDRIRLLAMPGDPDPIPPGSTGTVTMVKHQGSGANAWLQTVVDWDNGRGLMLSAPPDEFEVISGNKGN